MTTDDRIQLWQRIERRLNTELPGWRDLIASYHQVSAVQDRAQGRRWSDPEVFEGLVRSVLSNSTDWAKVERVLPELQRRFHGFDPTWYAALAPTAVEEELVAWFRSRRAGSMTLRQDLVRLISSAQRLLELAERFGSFEAYLQGLFDRHVGDPKRVVRALGGAGSPEKLPGLGIPLAAEFLKNLGFDVSKPDRHINRALGCFGMVRFSRWPDRSGTLPPQATESELLEVMEVVEQWAAQINAPVTFLDNAVWLLCAKSGLYSTNADLAALAPAWEDHGSTVEARGKVAPKGNAGSNDTYATRLQQHLARYKLERLGVEENGIWLQNKRSYPHILPEQLKRLNIHETIRTEFWRYLRRKPVRLHRDFHHLTSSQALAFNLFFPFFGLEADCTEALLAALEIAPERVLEWGFEHVLDAEEGTHFDFFMELAPGRRVVFEVKLAETGFGGCTADDAHRRKLREIYRPRLTSKVEPDALQEEAFFRNYQLLRNISYAGERSGTMVVFLLPQANTGASAYLAEFLASTLLPPARTHVRVQPLETLIGTLASLAELGPLIRSHLRLLQEKYTLPRPGD